MPLLHDCADATDDEVTANTNIRLPIAKLKSRVIVISVGSGFLVSKGLLFSGSQYIHQKASRVPEIQHMRQ